MRWLVGPIPACFVLLAYRLQWAMDELAGEMILRLPEYAFIQIYSNMRMLICKWFVSLDPAKHLTCLVSLMEQSWGQAQRITIKDMVKGVPKTLRIRSFPGVEAMFAAWRFPITPTSHAERHGAFGKKPQMLSGQLQSFSASPHTSPIAGSRLVKWGINCMWWS